MMNPFLGERNSGINALKAISTLLNTASQSGRSSRLWLGRQLQPKPPQSVSPRPRRSKHTLNKSRQ
jgi:hypothetical protein